MITILVKCIRSFMQQVVDTLKTSTLEIINRERIKVTAIHKKVKVKVVIYSPISPKAHRYRTLITSITPRYRNSLFHSLISLE